MRANAWGSGRDLGTDCKAIICQLPLWVTILDAIFDNCLEVSHGTPSS